jgi:hypothetical protein
MKLSDAVTLASSTAVRMYSLLGQSFNRHYSSYYQDYSLVQRATLCITRLQFAITQLAMKKVCWCYQNLAVNLNMTPRPAAFPPFYHEVHKPRDWKIWFECPALWCIHALDEVEIEDLSFAALTAKQASWDTKPPALSIQNDLPKFLRRLTIHPIWPQAEYSIGYHLLTRIHSLSRPKLDAAISSALSSTPIRVNESCL